VCVLLRERRRVGVGGCQLCCYPTVACSRREPPFHVEREISRPMAVNVSVFVTPVCGVPAVNDEAPLTTVVSWWPVWEREKQVGYSSVAGLLNWMSGCGPL